MSASTASHIFDNSSVANFKDWAQSISTFMATAGWVQTSDTGQVNWSTISVVPGSNSYVYEIWRMNDSLQSTLPVFMKIEYGNYGGTNVPGMRITVGTGSNGSGTITGTAVIGPSQIGRGGGSSGNATNYQCHYSGDSGRIGILMWRDGIAPQFFGAERTLDSTGAANNEGVTVMLLGPTDSNGWTTQQSIQFASPNNLLASVHARGPLTPLEAQDGSSENLNNIVPLAPVFPCYGKFGNPLTIVAAMKAADATEGATFTATQYGSTRTFLSTKGSGGATKFDLRSSGNTAFVMRYD